MITSCCPPALGGDWCGCGLEQQQCLFCCPPGQACWCVFVCALSCKAQAALMWQLERPAQITITQRSTHVCKRRRQWWTAAIRPQVLGHPEDAAHAGSKAQCGTCCRPALRCTTQPTSNLAAASKHRLTAQVNKLGVVGGQPTLRLHNPAPACGQWNAMTESARSLRGTGHASRRADRLCREPWTAAAAIGGRQAASGRLVGAAPGTTPRQSLLSGCLSASAKPRAGSTATELLAGLSKLQGEAHRRPGSLPGLLCSSAEAG